MRLPRIEALDLRTEEGQRAGALSLLSAYLDELNAQDLWIPWDEISWEFPRVPARLA